MVPCLVFALLGTLAIWFPEVLGNGKGLVQRTYTNQLGLALLIPLLLIKFVAAPACLSSGVPGGLFTPTLTVGALLGSVLGQIWAMFFPAPDLGVFAIVGSAAMLAAATQGPISSVAFLIELTHQVDALMVPVLLAIVGASLVTQRVETRSVYSARVRQGMMAAKKVLLRGTCFDHLATDSFSVATSAATLNTLQTRLLTRGDPLFVIDNEGGLVGSFSRSDVAAANHTLPTATLTAADLAQPVKCVLSTASEPEAIAAVCEQPGRIIPVVEPHSGHLLGAIGEPGADR